MALRKSLDYSGSNILCWEYMMTIDGYNGFPIFLLPDWIPLAMKRVPDFGLGWKNIE